MDVFNKEWASLTEDDRITIKTIVAKYGTSRIAESISQRKFSFSDGSKTPEEAGISDYPSFICTSSSSIKNKLQKNDYIKEVTIKKKFWGKIYVYIKEEKILALYNNKLILEDGKVIDNNYNIMSVPILNSDITNIKDKFVSKISLIDDEILLKISEIVYVPNEVDNERFIFKMNDGNLVYITLTKITKINKYNSIYSGLEGKKGIIYLDSGDYVEVKE